MAPRKANVIQFFAGATACAGFLYVIRTPVYSVRTPVHLQVKVVYLVPKDLRPRQDFPEAAHRAMAAAQRWYFDELGHGVTFPLADPPVTTMQTEHSGSWYRSVAGKRDDADALWDAAIDEAFDLTGGSYEDRRYLWVYFLDVDLPAIPAQGARGLALLLRKEIVNLMGPQPRCAALGTIVHEMGHAFGVDHPPDCDSHRKGASDPVCASMSYVGGYSFPHARFLPAERSQLLQDPTFIAIPLEGTGINCVK
jgi:hypothetical protein